MRHAALMAGVILRHYLRRHVVAGGILGIAGAMSAFVFASTAAHRSGLLSSGAG